jgi:hypothetical protein
MSHSIKSRILYNVENNFFLEMHDCYARGIYIYSFLFPVHLIKCKTKKYHTVGTIAKSTSIAVSTAH